MTANRRIVLNIVATYGRSLYAMVIGIFTARWALHALGVVDYGLYGVIGGLSAFIAFFNNLLSGAIGRFYAFAVGQTMVTGQEEAGLEECRRWFSIAVMIHTLIPTVLMLVGFPLGLWAINHFLTIPADRISDCRWVFVFVCITCYVGMVNAPFSAMYGAKQYIAELTIYSFVSTTLNVIFMGYMVTHERVWLIPYAVWCCMLSVLPQVIISLRAVYVFKECRFRFAYCFDFPRIKELFGYAFWCAITNLGALVRIQGVSVLVNKYFGPACNATLAIGNSVASHAESLSAALKGAFSPAIANLAGAGQKEKMLMFACRSSKFGSILFMLFAVPLSLELPYVLRLWLKSPPDMLAEVCAWTLAYTFLGILLRGIDTAVFVMGKIGMYASAVGIFMIFSLPVNWVLVHYNVCGFISVCYVLVAFRALAPLFTLPMARRLVGFKVGYFLFRIALPVLFTLACVLALGYLPHIFMSEGFLRLGITIATCEIVLIPFALFVILDGEERVYVYGQISKKIPLRRFGCHV